MEYSGVALVLVAGDAGVSFHAKRSLDAVVVRWEQPFGRTLPPCVVFHSVANKQTRG